MNISDTVLASAKSGDVSSLNAVLSVATRVAKVVCGRYVSHRSDIDDIAQTVAIRIYKNLDNCQATSEAQFVAWVTTASRNACIDYHRATSRREIDSLGENDFGGSSKDFEAIDAGEVLNRAAAECGLQDVVELAMAGCSFSEIGERLGMTKRKVQWQFSRYKKAVQEMMEPTLV